MRQIKASEVKPGMEIEWTKDGVLHRLTPNRISTCRSNSPFTGPDRCTVTGHNLHAEEGGLQWVSVDQEVTVLSEPAPAQPEEPTEFGAKITVDGRQFLRAPLHSSDPTPWLSQLDNIWRDWDYLINMGPVTVVPDQGWTVPVETATDAQPKEN